MNCLRSLFAYSLPGDGVRTSRQTDKTSFLQCSHSATDTVAAQLTLLQVCRGGDTSLEGTSGICILALTLDPVEI